MGHRLKAPPVLSEQCATLRSWLPERFTTGRAVRILCVKGMREMTLKGEGIMRVVPRNIQVYSVPDCFCSPGLFIPNSKKIMEIVKGCD